MSIFDCYMDMVFRKSSPLNLLGRVVCAVVLLPTLVVGGLFDLVFLKRGDR